MRDDYAILVEAANRLGEGPAWMRRHDALFWVDIVAQRLWRRAASTGEVAHWDMPAPIGWIVERAGRDDFLIGLKSGVAALDLDPFAIHPVAAPEPDRPGNRLNDAKVDAAGRLWFGSKDDVGDAPSGALYRLDPDGALSRHDDGYIVTNGPAFSPDGRFLYHNDSGRGLVYRYARDDDGGISDRQVLITFEGDWGYPDGMTTDAEGGLWIAHWAGSRVSRFDPDGRLIRSWALPARNITSCAFGGEALDRLFVTSASLDSPGSPADGALFEIDPGVRGLPATPYGG
ncbi:SMP-30/gluconolactonase/LRE family protein [Sphingomonas baiyangensis]|uniref:SMP-30/gluconolactonase/LRE family protein n=1 Tax=Sphingomonas baiyangensis TaxID=2572576 RepID=A0A4U1L6E5_9SPHN|nr:SMP-30/gluconolactonase/LRE family protein [Sphingomonas baiyangensis]TKD51835.1 SMP-30/gluconolactonase/LRE family protein [Sphingomonas baiyangensis]